MIGPQLAALPVAALARHRRRLHVVVAFALGAAVFAGCGAAPSPPAPAASVTAPTPSPTLAASSATAAVNVEITLKGGRADKVQTIDVDKGEQVKITAVSDVAETLHLHGYDGTLNLEPNQPASMTFTADVPGVFELETHDSGQLVAKFVVS